MGAFGAKILAKIAAAGLGRATDSRLGAFGARILDRFLCSIAHMKAMVKNIKNTLFWALFSNLDGFLQSIAHMSWMPFGRNCQFSDYITLQVTVSSVFNNTAKLHMSVQLLNNTPNNVSSMRSPLPVNVRLVNFLLKTETWFG